VTQIFITPVPFDIRESPWTPSDVPVRTLLGCHDVIFVRPERILPVDHLSHTRNPGRVHVEMVGVLMQERLARAVAGDEIRRCGGGQSTGFSTTFRTEPVAVEEEEIPIDLPVCEFVFQVSSIDEEWVGIVFENQGDRADPIHEKVFERFEVRIATPDVTLGHHHSGVRFEKSREFVLRDFIVRVPVHAYGVYPGLSEIGSLCLEPLGLGVHVNHVGTEHPYNYNRKN